MIISLILAALAVIFFFVYSFLIYNNLSAKFTWPDETANYFFIKNYIQTSNLSVSEPLNLIADEVVKPRSFNVYQGALVPGSFLGMLLIYGLIGKVVGLDLVVLLTPLLAIIAGIYFYKLIKLIFGKRIGFLSALLFFINPAWWYYASFFMLPNVSFLTFLIIGFYYLIKIDKFNKKNNILFLILSSFFISLALTIRTNEFFWVLPIVIALLAIYYKKIEWWYAIIFLAVMALVFLPILLCNAETYGSFLSFGYLRLGQGGNLISQLPAEFRVGNDALILNFVGFLFLPFGFNPGLAFINIIKYYFALFWWLSLPALLGILVLWKIKAKKDQIVFAACSIFASLYLTIYYGSWLFEDKLTLALNMIGISYVRYFLPIYILSLPFAVLFFVYLINLFQNKKIRLLLSLFLIILFLALSINVVFISGNDNLIKIKQNIADYTKIDKIVIGMTENNAVIVSQRSDKIFFPERKVVIFNSSEVKSLSKLLNTGVPLYYFSTSNGETASVRQELTKNNLTLIFGAWILNTDYLYKIKFSNE
ncbi:MAG: hypothetical protein PHC97_02570 [Patescibacteria group bacterium]|nr:hypothetical protein [Patescibacteria group bacterium]